MFVSHYYFLREVGWSRGLKVHGLEKCPGFSIELCCEKTYSQVNTVCSPDWHLDGNT